MCDCARRRNRRRRCHRLGSRSGPAGWAWSAKLLSRERSRCSPSLSTRRRRRGRRSRRCAAFAILLGPATRIASSTDAPRSVKRTFPELLTRSITFGPESESTTKDFGARVVDAKLTVAELISAVQAANRDFRLTGRNTHCCAFDCAVCKRALRPFSAGRRSIRRFALQREIAGRQRGVFQNPGDVLSRNLPLILAGKLGIRVVREFAADDEFRMHHRDIERSRSCISSRRR